MSDPLSLSCPGGPTVREEPRPSPVPSNGLPFPPQRGLAPGSLTACCRGEEAPAQPPNPAASCLAAHKALKASGPGTSKAWEAHCVELSVSEAEACGLHFHRAACPPACCSQGWGEHRAGGGWGARRNWPPPLPPLAWEGQHTPTPPGEPTLSPKGSGPRTGVWVGATHTRASSAARWAALSVCQAGGPQGFLAFSHPALCSSERRAQPSCLGQGELGANRRTKSQELHPPKECVGWGTGRGGCGGSPRAQPCLPPPLLSGGTSGSCPASKRGEAPGGGSGGWGLGAHRGGRRRGAQESATQGFISGLFAVSRLQS